MAIRLSGLASNMDTDSMVQELVKASSAKKTNLEKAQTKLGWKQTAWKDLNAKVYSFFNKALNDMRASGGYNKKTTIVADERVASVVAGNSSVNGTQTLFVERLAAAGYLTGAKLSDDRAYKKNSTLKNMGALAEGETAKLQVTTGGRESTIELNADMTVDDLTKKLNAAGVTASFDEVNQRFYIAAKGSGEQGDFSLTAQDGNALKALSKLGLITKEDVTNNDDYAEWAAYQGANDTETLQNLVDAGKISEEVAKRVAQMKAENETLGKSNDNIDTIITRLRDAKAIFIETDLFKNAMQEVDPSGINTVEDNIAVLESSIETIKTEQNRFAELTEKSEDPEQTLTPEEQAELDTLQAKSEDGSWDKLEAHTKNLAIVSEAKAYDTDIEAEQAKIDANNAKIAANNDRIGSGTDADGNVVPGAGSGTALLTGEVNADFLKQVTAAVDALAQADSIPTGEKAAVRVIGKDAKIILNGAAYDSSSNTFSVNGLTITAKALSTENTTINTDMDVDGIYKQIKGFITEYNKLIKEMDTLYGAKSAKGYDPLTAEEKDTMSEGEITEWEKKIKDSLLRSDTNLNSVTNLMKTGMMEGFMVNGKKISLTTYGIEPQNYFNAPDNEKGVYHIAGDQDDSASKGGTDKLKTAIAANPEEVGNFFSQFTSNLYDKMNTQMQRIRGQRSIYNVYDDQKMAADYKDYTDKIKAQEKKLTALEDRYYKQFSAMEVAMSKLNSSQSSLSSLLGG